MDGASAIITFVVVALQSAKAVHGTLSAVKDGPRNLQNVIHSVEELSNLLERLESIFRSGEHDNNDLIAVSELAERCAKDMRRFNESISKLSISPQMKKFGRFWKRLKTALDEKELDRMRTILQGYTSSIALRLITYQSAKTSASASQFSRIQDILETLGDRFSRLNNKDSDPASLLSHDAEGATASQIKPTWTSDLEHSISRLCDLVDVEGHTRDSEDAEQLIEDLKKLLDTAHNLESQIPEIESTAATSLGSYVEPVSNLAKELKLASSLVSSAPFISVNSIGEAKRYTFNRPSGIITQQQRKRKDLEMPDGTLTITTNKRCRSWSQDRRASQTTAGTATVTGKDWLIKVSYTPKASCRMITVYLDQSAMLHAALSSIPRLSVNNVLPMDAPVFDIARTGRVEDLTRLIAEGCASLRDHDPRGFSLLHYAVRNPSMCKYLIQNGLDIDQVVGWPSYETTPLHEAMNYSNNETAALLLEAGADPTVGFKERGSVLCWSALCITPSNKLVLKRILIDSHHLDVFNQRDEQGNTPILLACAHGRGARSILRFFVEQGSNIHDRNYDGETCLHLLVSRGCYLYSERLCDCLDFLLEQGADPRATDNKGRSVADAAYSDMGERSNGLASLVGDFFDACLVSHGYDLYEFRKGKPRVAQCNAYYPRKDFELLWKGIEDECPYWDDKPWPTDENEDSNDCDRSECSEERFEDEISGEGTDVDVDREHENGGDYHAGLCEEYDEGDERSGTGIVMATDEGLGASAEGFDEQLVGSLREEHTALVALADT